jgi:class 3 adenylate cyclase
MAPQVRYTKNRDGHIAYETFGRGDLELVVAVGPVSHLEVLREQPDAERFLERLGRFARVAVFDRRGMGLSDPLSRPVTLEEQVEDLEAVINAAGFQCPALLGLSDQGRTCILFAATHPGRTRALVTAGTAPYGAAAMTPDYAGSLRDAVEHAWGQAQLIGVLAPSRKDDLALREWCMRAERLSASPQAMLNLIETISRADVRDVLATVQTPTLVLHRRGDRMVSPTLGQKLAEAIPHARFVELAGDDAIYLLGDVDALADQVEEFLTGTHSEQPSDRILASLLVTDIVRSTERVSALGDARWRELMVRHDAVVRRQLDRFGGREVKHTGDGFLARFDGPGRAIHCAVAALEAVGGLDLELRCGVHTGECELVADDLRGLAVHIAARIAALAEAHEVLVSRTVKDLVVGSGIEFTDRGTQALKGVPGKWPTYAVQ